MHPFTGPRRLVTAAFRAPDKFNYLLAYLLTHSCGYRRITGWEVALTCYISHSAKQGRIQEFAKGASPALPCPPFPYLYLPPLPMFPFPSPRPSPLPYPLVPIPLALLSPPISLEVGPP